MTRLQCIEALSHLLDRQASYIDGEVVLPFDSHAKALGAVLNARDALMFLRNDEWRPIATAPRDGTRIIAYPVVLGECGIVTWERPARTPPMMRLVSNENENHDGFWRVLLSQAASPYEPTHWMPLPDPPRADQKPRVIPMPSCAQKANELNP